MSDARAIWLYATDIAKGAVVSRGMVSAPADRAHMNFLAWRRFVALTGGRRVVERPGMQFVTSPDDVYAAKWSLRTDAGVDPDSFLSAARSNHGDAMFRIMCREDVDADLIEVLKESGFVKTFEETAMVLSTRPEIPSAPDVALVSTQEHVEQLNDVLDRAFSNDSQPGLLSSASGPVLLEADCQIKAHLVRDGDQPVAGALNLVVDGTGGIYRVGTVPEARCRGFGTKVLAASVDTAFERGAEFVTLQASPSAVSVYERFGFEPVFTYEVWFGQSN